MTAAAKRRIIQTTKGQATSDGAGVKLVRLIGGGELDMVDPFLLLDFFASNDPGDYIAGFPNHPHRGFETVSYLLAGRLRHKDSTGREGVIGPGGVQWMSAGKGIVHSEMPEQAEGLLYGFQLWVNLPAANKMDAPRYQEYEADEIPLARERGGNIRVIAGVTEGGVKGPVTAPHVDACYFDVELVPEGTFSHPLPEDYTAFIYVMSGGVMDGTGETATIGEVAVLGPGVQVALDASAEGARFLFLAARPLGEPVARGGPFVMNTNAELTQAYSDYQAGRF